MFDSAQYKWRKVARQRRNCRNDLETLFVFTHTLVCKHDAIVYLNVDSAQYQRSKSHSGNVARQRRNFHNDLAMR